MSIVKKIVKAAVRLVKSVVKTVGDVVKAALDDPITTIAKVAAYATGNGWAIPLIDGASTVAKGGSISDGIKAAAISYGTQKIGTAVGKAAGKFASTAFEATTKTAKLVENIVTSGASRATVAIVTNQDPVKAFLTGGVTAATGAILGKVDGFKDQPRWVRNTVSATVASAVTGNKDTLTQTVANEIVLASGIVSKALTTFDPNNKMSESQRLIAADAIFRTTAAAVAGKSPDEALTRSLTNAAVKSLGEFAKEGIATVSNSLASAYAKVAGTGDKLDAIATKANDATTQYNSVTDSLNAALAEEQRLKAIMDAAVARHNNAADNTYLNSANQAVDAYENYVTSLNKSYNEYYKPELDRLSQQLTAFDTEYQELTGVLRKDQGALQSEIDNLTTTLDPIYANSNRAFAESLLPGFDAEAYRKLNPNIPADADPFLHYIAEGQFQGLKGTQEQLVQVRTDFANSQLEADLKEFVYDGSRAESQDAAEAEAKARGYNTYTFGGQTVTIMPEAELDARVGLVEKILKEQGKTLSTATEAEIGRAAELVSKVPQQAVDGASIQDLINGNYSGWRGGKYVTKFDTEDGKGTATFDPENGLYTMDVLIRVPGGLRVQEVSKGSIQDLATTDPEAYLQMASQFDAQAKGDFGDFFTNSLNAAVLAAHATGNKTLAKNLQQTLSIGSQGIGEQVENLAKFIASTTGMSYDNAMARAGQSMQEWGVANQSASTLEQEKRFMDTIADADGVFNKLKAVPGAAAENPLGFLTLVAKEGVQQVLPLWAARGVMAAGKLVAYSTNAAIEGIESWGSNAGEVYDEAIKQGRSESEARAMASKVGFQSFVVSTVANGIGDVPVVRKIIGDSVSDSFGDILKGSGREAVTEYFDELLTNANNQRTLYGTVNWDYATTAATIGAGLGAGTTAGILTGMSFNNNAVVAKDMDGRNVTLTDFLEGTKNVNMSTVNLNTNIGTTKNGNTVTLGTTLAMPVVSGVSYNTVTAGVPSILQNQNIVIGKDALGNNLTLANLMGQVDDKNSFESVYKTNAATTAKQRAEAQKNLIEQSFKDAGYTTFTADDVDSLLNVNSPGGTQAFVSSAETYAAPRVTTAEEARQFLLDSGYTNPTQEEINQFIGSVSDDDSKRLVADYVSPRIVTEDDARAFFQARGYVPNEQELAQFVRQGIDVRKTQVEQELGAYVDPRQVTKDEAKQFFEALGYRPTDDEITQFIQQGPEVQQSIVQQLLGEYVDPRMVTTDEARKAFEDLGFKGATAEDIERLTGQYMQEELAGRTKDILPIATYNATQAEIQRVAALVGKPARQVTQADIDLVNQMVADQQTDLAYDANQDGRVDQTDIDFMTRLMAGNVDQPWAPAQGTAWAPTGLYAAQAEEAERTRQEQAKQAEQARRLQLQGQARQGLMGIAQQLPQAVEQSYRRIDPIYAQTRYHSFQAPLFQTNLWGEQPAQTPTNQPNQFRMASGGYLDPQGEPQTWDDIYRMLK